MDKLNYNRYMKQILLPEVGLKGQKILLDTKVLVVGVGGLGCPVLQYLNAVGVGALGFVDFDCVETSNLHRQILYNKEDIGKKKVEVAFEKLVEQNPETKLVAFPEKLEDANVFSILKDYDVVIDGCDNFKTRYLVNDACVTLGKPLIYGSILDFEGHFAVFNHNGGKNLRELFPELPNTKDVPNCSDNGVLGTFPGIIGSLMAQEALKVILDLKPLHNQLMIFDTMSLKTKKISF